MKRSVRKSMLILSLALCLTMGAFGFEKGYKSISGSFSLNIMKHNDSSQTITTLSVTPRFSYFIMDNLSLEVSPSLTAAWFDGSDDNFIGFGAGLGARYFISQFYIGGALHLLRDGFAYPKRTSLYLTISAGRLFSIAKNVYLDAGLLYERGLSKHNFPTGSWSDESSLISTRLGIAVFFK